MPYRTCWRPRVCAPKLFARRLEIAAFHMLKERDCIGAEIAGETVDETLLWNDPHGGFFIVVRYALTDVLFASFLERNVMPNEGYEVYALLQRCNVDAHAG